MISVSGPQKKSMADQNQVAKSGGSSCRRPPCYEAPQAEERTGAEGDKEMAPCFYTQACIRTREHLLETPGHPTM